MINYSNNQKKAVEYGKGPLLVLAGPGSGKTLVITHRVRYLIEHYQAAPENILVVSFSRAAAMEMRKRFLELTQCSEPLDSEYGRITWATFHSFFFSILRRAYGYSGEQVAGEEERYSIIRSLIKNNDLGSEDIGTLSEALLSEIATVKQNKIKLELYYAKTCGEDIFRKIFNEYETALGSIKKIDFEDMLSMVYELLGSREDIRRACEQRYRYILIDEFQDINRLQYDIIRLIAGKNPNLTIVGDDDQSIYRFRGAVPEIMLGFEKDYPNTKRILLDINFRSSIQIVEASLRLISHNKKRFPKQIQAKRGESAPVKILKFKNPLSQSYGILEDIRAYIASGMGYEDIAVLYRTNIQPRILIKIFTENAIPFQLRDYIPDIFEHWITKDIISYLKIVLGRDGREDWLRIINRPNRFIKREAFYSGAGGIRGLMDYYADSEGIVEKIKTLQHNLIGMQGLNTVRSLGYIRKAIGYEGFIREYSLQRGIDEEDFLSILNELEQSAAEHPDPREWFEYMRTYKEEILAVQKSLEKGNASGVKLMSFHAAKGLEYKVVYIIDANEGIVPHKKALSLQDLEEERRMFYVAMTRARDRLFICYCESGFGNRIEPSRFLREIG